VDRARFERASSRQAASELAQLNGQLDGRPYVLIGVGRWGSTDPWLGIPVTWEQISGARVIVEAGFADFKVTPSQGTHFFQNLTSFDVGYFTVNPDAGDGFVDWGWLLSQPAVRETAYVRHLRYDKPVVVKMNGKNGEGVILKTCPPRRAAVRCVRLPDALSEIRPDRGQRLRGRSRAVRRRSP